MAAAFEVDLSKNKTMRSLSVVDPRSPTSDIGLTAESIRAAITGVAAGAVAVAVVVAVAGAVVCSRPS